MAVGSVSTSHSRHNMVVVMVVVVVVVVVVLHNMGDMEIYRPLAEVPWS